MSSEVVTVLCKRRITADALGMAGLRINDHEFAIGNFTEQPGWATVLIDSPAEYTAEELEGLKADLGDEFEDVYGLPEGIESRVRTEGKGIDDDGLFPFEWGMHFACAFDGTVTDDCDDSEESYADAKEKERQQSLAHLRTMLRHQS
jgi:hypothetical protein